MCPAPTYAPMCYGAEGQGYQALGPQSTVMQPTPWPSWNTPTATVKLPGATAHCLGAVNNPVLASGNAPGMPMLPAGANNGVTMMAGPPMFMAAPPAQPP